MSDETSSALSRGRRSRASTTSQLPHWSEVPTQSPRARPSPTVANVLRDLISWAADITIVLTGDCPEDLAAIERVRRYALAWLAGATAPDLEIDDVLTTAAALMAGIDLHLSDTTSDEDEDERHALGAVIPA